MRVLKFGGTSLGDAQRMRNVASIVSNQGPVLVVLSAVAGTTDSLVRIADYYKHGEFNQVKEVVELLLNHYRRYVDALYDEQGSKTAALQFVESQLADIAGLARVDLFD